jgi:hypothetical protein
MTKEKITIMNAKLCYKNFAGKETEFNAAGARNFSVILDDELAQELMSKGYNVKVKPPREGYDDDGNFNTLKINVKFGSNPALNPQIIRIMNGKKVNLNERTIGSLDWDEIENVDLRIRPYSWARAGRSGVAAYLESMYVTVVDDPLAAKYQDEHIDDFISDEEVPFE